MKQKHGRWPQKTSMLARIHYVRILSIGNWRIQWFLGLCVHYEGWAQVHDRRILQNGMIWPSPFQSRDASCCMTYWSGAVILIAAIWRHGSTGQVKKSITGVVLLLLWQWLGSAPSSAMTQPTQVRRHLQAFILRTEPSSQENMSVSISISSLGSKWSLSRMLGQGIVVQIPKVVKVKLRLLKLKVSLHLRR